MDCPNSQSTERREANGRSESRPSHFIFLETKTHPHDSDSNAPVRAQKLRRFTTTYLWAKCSELESVAQVQHLPSLSTRAQNGRRDRLESCSHFAPSQTHAQRGNATRIADAFAHVFPVPATAHSPITNGEKRSVDFRAAVSFQCAVPSSGAWRWVPACVGFADFDAFTTCGTQAN
jgi:hypothetical protein